MAVLRMSRETEYALVTALNDIALVKEDMARMINIELIINGALADRMPCDGMLVATPTGFYCILFVCGRADSVP